MTARWKIAVSISCIALIFGIIIWRVQRIKTGELKLAHDAIICRARAEQGDAKAEADLGSMYSQGKGVSQDYAEALRWYHKAAEQGDAKAEADLGSMYSQGKGVSQDYVEALRWYHKAADQGDAKAE